MMRIGPIGGLLTLLLAVAWSDGYAADTTRDGLWAGEMRQWDGAASEAYPMTVRLSGDRGTVDYPSLGCAGTWQLVSDDGRSQVFRETITRNRADQNKQSGCLDGFATVSVEGGNLAVAWAGVYNGVPYVASAVLAAKVTP
jgi:hypothetical protein